MPQDGLAPLFDGAAWAGTQLWEAAVEGINYMEQTYGAELARGANVIELGCGTGIPGMCCRLMGAKVLLTEQADLLPLLNANLASAFPDDRFDPAPFRPPTGCGPVPPWAVCVDGPQRARSPARGTPG